MSIQGYIDYQRREYCKAVQCPVQVLLDQEQPGTDKSEFLRNICKTDCLHTCHEFHAWLNQNSYEVVRPE
jgi:hypothetical protein